MMNSLDWQRWRQDAMMKRRWQSFNSNNSNTFFFNKLMETPPPPSPFPFPAGAISRNPSFTSKQLKQQDHHGFLESDEQLIVWASSMVVPAVTVVLEGRSICQRISLQKHESYGSLARALRQMFVEEGDDHELEEIDLSNAIPGYLIAYEDMDNDLLLAGDLNWNDFVRVAKRIRIVPVKPNSRKSLQRSTSA